MSQKPTTRVGIDRDEWYPVYSIVDADRSYAETVEIPTALIERADKALEEFDAVQELLRAAYYGEEEQP